MIHKRPHSKQHLSAIMSKYAGYDLLSELQRYLDTICKAESDAVDYAFNKKYMEDE